MNALEMLKLGGCANTPKGRAEFHKKYPTPEHFFAKHGGELSGAPPDGQPTEREFFSWGQPIIGPQGFYADGGSNKMKLSNADVVKMATSLLKSPYSSTEMGHYNKLSEVDKTRVRSTYDTASKYSAGSKGKFPFTPGSNAYWKSDLKDASDSAQYLSGYQRGEPLNREEAIGRVMFIQNDLDDRQPSILNPTMSGEFQRNDDYEKSGQGWSFKKMGGDIEYQKAYALVSKAMGGQAGIHSTDDFLEDQQEGFMDYLNQNSLNNQDEEEYMMNMRRGGNLTRFDGGGGPNPDVVSDNGGRGGPGSRNNYSDGYAGNNNQDPNLYRNVPTYGAYGYNQYNPMLGSLGNSLFNMGSRFGTKWVDNSKYSGNIIYGNQASSGSGAGSGFDGGSGGGSSSNTTPAAGSQANSAMSGYAPDVEIEYRKRLFSKKPGAIKKIHATWKPTGAQAQAPVQGSAGSNASGSGSGSGSSAPSYNQMAFDRDYAKAMGNDAGFPSSYKATMGPDMTEPDTQLNLPAFSGKYMSNYMNEADAPLPQMNVLPAEQQKQNQVRDYMKSQLNVKANSKPQPEEIFSGAPNPGSAYAPTLQRYGGVPKYGGGGSGRYESHPDDVLDLRSRLNFSLDNGMQFADDTLNVANSTADFFNNAQQQRLMGEQRERLQNPLYTNADLEEKGNQITFDNNIASNVRQTPRLTNFVGDSNVDKQISGFSRYGGQKMQGGGSVKEGDIMELSDYELKEFLAGGGVVEYLDEE